MPDIADFANDLVLTRLDQAMAKRSAAQSEPMAHSFLFCEGCDEPIPEKRRLAQRGCTQCLSCQSVTEARESRHAR